MVDFEDMKTVNASRTLKRYRDRVQRRISALERLSSYYTWARLLVFMVGVVVSLATFFTLGAWPFAGALLGAASLFILVVHRHRRIEETLQRFQLLLRFLHSQAARIRREWASLPPARAPHPRFDHPFEGDIDVTGEHGLHRLLDTAATAEGSARLRAWLTATVPDNHTISLRQQRVEELRPLHLLRHKLWISATRLAAGEQPWDASRLLAWLQRFQAGNALAGWLVVLSVLAVANALLFLGDRLGYIDSWWRYTLGLYALLYLTHGRTIGGVFSEAAALRDEVARVETVFRHLEAFGFGQTPQLAALVAPFSDATHRPSSYLQRLAWVVNATGLQGNPLVALALNVVGPWGLFFAHQLNRCKAQIADEMPGWLDVWYELEALAALANFAELHPGYCTPQIGGQRALPVFQGKGIGHPLLPDSVKVRNDFQIKTLGEVVILTGSNMAGKSTYLRALGLNLVLAYTGSVVDAEALSTTLFRLFTCIRVNDSVSDGISYFYAEVQRLAALLSALETAHSLPLFFCIDEIFRGTNNRERLIGSRAYLHALVGKQGAGLIATHDLELVKLADELPGVRNFHFRDDIEDGRMIFDYILRAGPSPTTNALKIMRSVGLPVDSET
jgi:hypothetical protein